MRDLTADFHVPLHWEKLLLFSFPEGYDAVFSSDCRLKKLDLRTYQVRGVETLKHLIKYVDFVDSPMPDENPRCPRATTQQIYCCGITSQCIAELKQARVITASHTNEKQVRLSDTIEKFKFFDDFDDRYTLVELGKKTQKFNSHAKVDHLDLSRCTSQTVQVKHDTLSRITLGPYKRRSARKSHPQFVHNFVLPLRFSSTLRLLPSKKSFARYRSSFILKSCLLDTRHWNSIA